MNKILFLLLFIVTQSLKAQDALFTIKQNTDSLDLWEYKFVKSSEEGDEIGRLLLKRKQSVFNDDSSKSIIPQIEFYVYPLSLADSIAIKKGIDIQAISCCYPICGQTVYSSGNFLFWSDLNMISSAIECSGIDYTRKNAELILEGANRKNYSSIHKFLKQLPVKRMKE